MSELTKAINAVCEEKGLDYDAVLSTIEASLAAAYRKDYGNKNQNIKVKFDPETRETEVFDVKTVVEDIPEEEEGEEETEEEEGEEKKRFNPKTDIQLSDAKLIKDSPEIGEEIWTELEVPESYGRMAAQTAKQVIIQKLRESEREMILGEFKEKENEVVSGIVQRREGRRVSVDLGKAAGYIPPEEQVPGERYNAGDRIKVYIKSVEKGAKGPDIVLSRISEEILKKIFYLEIPEVSNGLIEIKGVAREAGARSKVAIWTDSDSIDPIGSCVGQKGGRIQTIINELGGERIDIVEYSDDPATFIAHALSPAKVLNVEVDESKKRAGVKVSPDQFSLAIGKRGQNVRLAAALTGWNIDIVEHKEEENSEGAVYSSEYAEEEAAPEEVKETGEEIGGKEVEKKEAVETEENKENEEEKREEENAKESGETKKNKES
jgi:N utilization substance protein A